MKFEPKGPQLEGIKWLVSKSFGALFWDPGRGKTITVLEAIQILKQERLIHRALITASVNICEDVWPTEIDKFDDLDLSYSVVTGSERERHAAWEMDADVLIINYENLWWLNHHYGKTLKKDGVDMFVVDESSKFRNGRLRPRRRRKKTAKVSGPRKNAFGAIVRMLPSFKRRAILTGTPSPKNYLNLWPQMYIVDQGRSLGTTLTGYKNRFFYPCGFKGYDSALREGADIEIQQAMAPRVHRAERDNAKGIEFFDVTVKLPPAARRVYDEIELEFIAQWRGKTLLAANAAVATAKLRQAANGALYHDNKKNWVALHEKKVSALGELIDEVQGAPVLIGYQFDHDYEMMKRFGLKIPRYAGSKSQKKELKDDWDKGRLPALCAQMSSISHGQNFQYGGYIAVCYGLTFDLDVYEQFYQRVWRDGQEEVVLVYHIMAEHTVDDVMLDVLIHRCETQRELLSAFRRRYDV